MEFAQSKSVHIRVVTLICTGLYIGVNGRWWVINLTALIQGIVSTRWWIMRQKIKKKKRFSSSISQSAYPENKMTKKESRTWHTIYSRSKSSTVCYCPLLFAASCSAGGWEDFRPIIFCGSNTNPLPIIVMSSRLRSWGGGGPMTSSFFKKRLFSPTLALTWGTLTFLMKQFLHSFLQSVSLWCRVFHREWSQGRAFI